MLFRSSPAFITRVALPTAISTRVARAIFQTKRRSLSVGVGQIVLAHQGKTPTGDRTVEVREGRLVAMPKGLKYPGELISSTLERIIRKPPQL